MPIDSSIYFQQQTPDFLGNIQKGLSMREMIDERAQKQAALAKQQQIEQAYQSGITKNPDGTVGFDSTKTLAGLANVKNAGREFVTAQNDFRTQKVADAEAQRKIHQVGLEDAAKKLSLIRDPLTYRTVLDQMKSEGKDISDFPESYDQKVVDAHIHQALGLKEQLEQANKDRDFDLSKNKTQSEIDKNKAETKKLLNEAGKPNANLSPGQKKADEDYAKDYNEWTSVGRNVVDKNLERLRQAKKALQDDDSLTGPIAGITPDVVRNYTNEKAITTRDDVRAAAQGALKATLGAQFTEKEGERIMSQAYNEKLSPAANIAKIDAAIRELEANRDANEKKAAYFQKSKGTLTGMDNTKPSIHELPDDKLDALYKELGGK